MSYSAKYYIPCPKCKSASEQTIFQSLNEETVNAAEKILSDEINFVTCPHCKNKFQVKTGLLYCNHSKGIAIYYHPSDLHAIDNELKEMERMVGKKSYLANPDKFTDWHLFKKRIAEAEQINKKATKTESFSNIARPFFKSAPKPWGCSICDGDESTGCQYFDPTECPRFN